MNIAILGCGSIAEKMATTLQPLKGITLYAVASRDAQKAQVFADKYGFQYAYGSYTDMLLNPNVELVYIATPHSHHYEHIKLCLRHNKHILCEKAFTANARQAEEVLREAESRGLLLTEAIWTRYMPMRKTINDIVKSGIIGKPTSLSANLGYPLEHVDRLKNPNLCGGALLDLGVYVLNFASMVFGDDIESMAATCIKYHTGVDAQETIMLTYKDGKMATLYVTFLAQTDRRGLINGTNGFIEIENINNYETVTVYNLERRVIAQYAAPAQVTGYEYEVQSAIKAIKEGQIECPEMPHYETLLMMQLMDNIRAAWGIRFPYEVEKVESDPDIDANAGMRPVGNSKTVSKVLENTEKEKPSEPVRLLKETGSLTKEPNATDEVEKAGSSQDGEEQKEKLLRTVQMIPGLEMPKSEPVNEDKVQENLESKAEMTEEAAVQNNVDDTEDFDIDDEDLSDSERKDYEEMYKKLNALSED